MYTGPNIITNGLVLSLDAANIKSYADPNTFISNVILPNTSYNFVGNVVWDSNSNSLLHTSPLITDSARYTISPSISFTDTQERTFEFLLKWNGGVNSLFGANSTSPWCSLQPVSGGNWRIRYRQQGGTYIDMNTVSLNTVDVRNWTYYTFRFNSDRTIELFTNGIPIGLFNTTSTQLNVTRIMGGYSSGGNVYDWNGNFSMCRFYNRVLTDSEIQQNYNATKSRYNI